MDRSDSIKGFDVTDARIVAAVARRPKLPPVYWGWVWVGGKGGIGRWIGMAAPCPLLAMLLAITEARREIRHVEWRTCAARYGTNK